MEDSLKNKDSDIPIKNNSTIQILKSGFLSKRSKYLKTWKR